MKAAIFDMDGTLIDSLIFWDYLWQKIGQTFLNDPNFRPDPQTDKDCRTVTMARAMELVQQRYRLTPDLGQLVALTENLARYFYTDVVEAKPGALNFLQHLKDKGVKMAVATASNPELVILVMDRLGITPYMDALVSCTTVGKGKDQPDVFVKTLEQLGTQAADTWMFEDSYVALQTARGLGMPTVGIYDKNNYGQDILQANSDHYIGPGQTLERLIGVIV